MDSGREIAWIMVGLSSWKSQGGVWTLGLDRWWLELEMRILQLWQFFAKFVELSLGGVGLCYACKMLGIYRVERMDKVGGKEACSIMFFKSHEWKFVTFPKACKLVSFLNLNMMALLYTKYRGPPCIKPSPINNGPYNLQ